MAVIRNSVQIDRSMEQVFDFISDPRNELKWNPDVVLMEMITKEPIGAGSKFRAKWKQSSILEIEITKYERPRVWSTVNGGPLSVNLDCTITPDDKGSGSIFYSRFEIHPHGLMILLFPLILLSLKRAEKNNMVYIKESIENNL